MLLFKGNVICTLPGLAESRTVERTRSESDIHFFFFTHLLHLLVQYCFSLTLFMLNSALLKVLYSATKRKILGAAEVSSKSVNGCRGYNEPFLFVNGVAFFSLLFSFC